MAKYMTEFVGTFFLVLTIGLTVTYDVAMGPLVIGGVLMALVYMGGHISRAHYNPAISIVFLIRGAMEFKDLIPYWIAQFTGAIAAAWLLTVITPSELTIEGQEISRFFGPEPGAGFSLTSPGVWLIEILFTFALALVILNVATSVKTAGNSYYGLAIGLVVLVGAFAGGHISGAAFNPAVGIGPNLIKGTMGGSPEAFQNFGLYTIGPLVGAVVANLVFKIQEDYVVNATKADAHG